MFFAGLTLVSFLLRILSTGRLYQDDGLWFTAAEEMVRGKVLYRQIYFDKPPVLPIVYTTLFKLFGPHIFPIRLFNIVYCVAISMVLYLFGKRLYDRGTGMMAAAMFTVFSTTYAYGDMQSLNTDLLMALPLAGGALLFIRAQVIPRRTRAYWLAAAAGGLIALASQTNPKGAAGLVFVFIAIAAARIVKPWGPAPTDLKWGLLVSALGGFVLASVPFLVYLMASRSLSFYWLYVWKWGLGYASYFPASRASTIFLTYSVVYFAQNNTLLIGLLIAVSIAIHRVYSHIRRRGLKGGIQESKTRLLFADAVVLSWCAVSFAAIAVGGRFFPHYYFMILPAVSVAAASGITNLWRALGRTPLLLRTGIAVLVAAGLAYTMVEFHSETFRLAAHWLRPGSTPESDFDNEDLRIAATVRDMPELIQDGRPTCPGNIRRGGPRERPPNGPSDYLFIWGNSPAVYYYSGLVPVSGYLSSQPLTGVPADVQYTSDEHRSLLDPALTSAARSALARDLEQTPPKYIVDELGPYDANLGIDRYPELALVMSRYEKLSSNRHSWIYLLKNSR